MKRLVIMIIYFLNLIFFVGFDERLIDFNCTLKKNIYIFFEYVITLFDNILVLKRCRNLFEML